MDAVIQTSDFPCMLKDQPGTGALAPPIFGYNSHPKFVDIPFPDYSYWGHEYRRLLGEPHPEPDPLPRLPGNHGVIMQLMQQSEKSLCRHMQAGMDSLRMGGRNSSAF